MHPFYDEPDVLDELKNLIYPLALACFNGLAVLLGIMAVLGFLAIIGRWIWGVNLSFEQPLIVRGWLAVFMLGSGLSLVMERWNSESWTQEVWWIPFASSLTAFWIYLVVWVF